MNPKRAQDAVYEERLVLIEILQMLGLCLST
jgi:hypothetical protein